MVKYKIKVHKKVITEDSKLFDEQTKEKIKKKCKELLSDSPEKVGEPLHFELKKYRKLKIFNDYRVIYRIVRSEVIVFVLAVGVRRDREVYKKAILRIQEQLP